MKEFFKTAQVILASNVSHYLYQDSSQEYWKAEDFPNIAPPFPNMWFEFERPEFILSDERGKVEWDTQHRPNRWGIAIRVYTNSTLPLDKISMNFDAVKETLATLDSPARWFLHCLLYDQFSWEQGLVVVGPIFTWLLPVDEQGSIGRRKGEAITIFSSIPDRGVEHSRNMRMECEGQLDCALLALSFMHCSNVVVRDNQPKERHSKLHQKRFSVPLVTYKTLEIEPMKRVLRHEGSSDTKGIQQAIHICRGHFKHFGPQWERGKLFGKIEGTFWWPSQVRGTADRGIVMKEYEVDKPDTK
jgi:hypothetical protein